MSIIWPIGVTVYPVFCVGYFTECVYLLSMLLFKNPFSVYNYANIRASHDNSISVTCVKCNGYNSHFFRLLAGVRQGGVLSPFLFAVFIDSVVKKIKSTGVGCHYFSARVSVFLYADDILLIAPSVSALQILLSACTRN